MSTTSGPRPSGRPDAGPGGRYADRAPTGSAARAAGTRGTGPARPEGAGERVRVLVVDDHPVVRSGIVGMLAGEQDLVVVAEAGDGAQAVATVATARPDVVLMDLRMPGTDGVEATRRILAEPGAPRVVVLTTYDTDGDILRAVEAGAIGYLLKDAAREDILAAVRAAAIGRSSLSPAVTTRLVGAARRGHGTPTAAGEGPVTLSPRETEVLRAVARGLSNASIGRELYISEATVKTHLLRVNAKLGVESRTAAVTEAVRRGLIDLG